MGTPTHTYCSLRDLLKNLPSPKPMFRNHSYSRTKPELQDLYTNMSNLDLSFAGAQGTSTPSPPPPPFLSQKLPSSQTNNAGFGNGKLCAVEKPPPVVESSDGCIQIHHPEKSKLMFVEEKINIDSDEEEDVMLAPKESDKDLKMSFAGNGAKEDAEKEEEIVEEKGAMESDDEEIEEKGILVESEKEIEEEEGEGILESKE